MSLPRPAFVNNSTSLRAALLQCLRRGAACSLVGLFAVGTTHADQASFPATTHTESGKKKSKAPPPSPSDTTCNAVTTRDPRIDDLLKGDPTDQRIQVTSDTGDLSRAGDASLTG